MDYQLCLAYALYLRDDDQLTLWGQYARTITIPVIPDKNWKIYLEPHDTEETKDAMARASKSKVALRNPFEMDNLRLSVPADGRQAHFYNQTKYDSGKTDALVLVEEQLTKCFGFVKL